MNRMLRSLVFAIGCSALAGLGAFAQNPKISRDLATADPSSTVPVIIQYAQDPGANEDAAVANVGGNVRFHMHTIHSHAVLVPQYKLAQLASNPNVTYISLDRPVQARQQVTITAADYTTEPINAPALWKQGYTGSGIGVAVIDSGITPVSDLTTGSSKNSTPFWIQGLLSFFEAAPGSNGRILYSQNFVSGQNNALDAYGHGTFVSGLIAGDGAESTGNQFFRTFYGAAPGANIINLRALDQNGMGTDSSVIAAIETAIALQPYFNIRVINLSLGRPILESYKVDPLCQAVEKAWQAGIVVVVAAGNDGRDLSLNPEGYGTIEAPGNDPYVITVGAMRTMETPQINDDLVASYSSKGPTFIDHIAKPDIVAPGNLVISNQFSGDSLAVNNPSFVTLWGFYRNGNPNTVSTDYFPLSGTSMSAGVASGAIADLLQAQPQLTPDQVKAYLMRNADQKYFPQTSSVVANGITYVANYDVFTVGAGYLDIAATLNDIKSGTAVPSGTAMSPVAVYNPKTGATTLVTTRPRYGAQQLCGARIASTEPMHSWAIRPRSGVQRRFGGRTIPTDLRPCGEQPLCGAPGHLRQQPLCGEQRLCGELTTTMAKPLCGVPTTPMAKPLCGVPTTPMAKPLSGERRRSGVQVSRMDRVLPGLSQLRSSTSQSR